MRVTKCLRNMRDIAVTRETALSQRDPLLAGGSWDHTCRAPTMESTVEAITAETRGAVASGSERIGNIERTESAADACTATGPRHGLDAFPIADDRCPDKMARFRACSVAVDTLSDSSPSEAITASASAETTADPRRDTLKSLVAGGAAGAVAKTCLAPIDRTKILLQVSRIHGDTRAYVSVLSTVRTIFHEEGVRGFFRGNSATLTRIAPYAAIQFSAFETYNGLLTRRYTAWRRRDHTDEASQAPPTALRFVAGAAAGTTAVIATYPLDVVRTPCPSDGTAPRHPPRVALAASLGRLAGAVPRIGRHARGHCAVRRGEFLHLRPVAAIPDDARPHGATCDGVGAGVRWRGRSVRPDAGVSAGDAAASGALLPAAALSDIRGRFHREQHGGAGAGRLGERARPAAAARQHGRAPPRRLAVAGGHCAQRGRAGAVSRPQSELREWLGAPPSSYSAARGA
eukprot:ctg_235.g142